MPSRSRLFGVLSTILLPMVVSDRFTLVSSLLKSACPWCVRAELVDVAANTQSWSERFDESLDDTLAVEAEFTRRIAEALRLEITGEEQATLARRRPVNREASSMSRWSNRSLITKYRYFSSSNNNIP